MNDEVPDEGDFDAGRRRGEFDDITPEDFIRGIGNPPGWLASDEINRMRGEMPIPYVLVVPVRTDDLGRVSQVGSLLRVSDLDDLIAQAKALDVNAAAAEEAEAQAE